MTDLQDRIIAALRMIPATNAADLAQIMGEDPRDVHAALHILDDAGRVLMRNGFYRLSKAEEQR